jgi:hypothetical protein
MAPIGRRYLDRRRQQWTNWLAPSAEITQVFRGIDAAASLKRPGVPRDEHDAGWVFRGIDAAASLKHGFHRWQAHKREGCFPRHRCRGLIEACTIGTRPARPGTVFRGIDAAASLKHHSSVSPWHTGHHVFRGIDAAASLKPGSQIPEDPRR